ncbi:galaxin isoform X2 [Triplophysa dalaica]|uniref:galaxin isoform X2 n=1 Tax=Triplophysa dalaica TaxID=1582913 RepID=UPI0024DF6F5D|nr:galaxin isoform X2 [Triplophysa dalaica]
MMLNSSISFVAILCVFASSSAQDVCGPDTESCSTDHNGGKTNVTCLHTCGNKQYNISEALCCNGTLICGLSRLVADCCESNAFNPLNEMCCNGRICEITNIKNRSCVPDGNESKSSDSGSTESKNNCTPVLQCGSKTYDPLTQMCCSGSIYKLSPLNKCCGTKAYSISEKVLCCNGTLHKNVPENSQCVGGYMYMENQTIMTYDTNVSIKVNRKAECCGKLPVGKDQTCCSSSSHAMLYKTNLANSCCGDRYYNRALWGCCAGDLTPTLKKDCPADNRLKMIKDLIPIMCNERVVFGKVESVALQNLVNRTIWLRVVREVSVPHCESLHLVSLDHCCSPALEIGETYLWKKNGTEFKPISLPIGQASDIHFFFAVCNKVNENICDV